MFSKSASLNELRERHRGETCLVAGVDGTPVTESIVEVAWRLYGPMTPIEAFALLAPTLPEDRARIHELLLNMDATDGVPAARSHAALLPADTTELHLRQASDEILASLVHAMDARPGVFAQVETLRLTSCHLVAPDSLLALVSALPRLRLFSAKLTSPFAFSLEPVVQVLCDRGVEALELYGVVANDEAGARVGEYMRGLVESPQRRFRRLGLDYIIADNFPSPISAFLAQHQPQLSHLTLTADDMGIAQIETLLTSLPELTHLDVSLTSPYARRRVYNLDGGGVRSIGKAELKRRRLDMSEAAAVASSSSTTALSLKSAFSSSHHLKSLRLGQLAETSTIVRALSACALESLTVETTMDAPAWDFCVVSADSSPVFASLTHLLLTCPSMTSVRIESDAAETCARLDTVRMSQCGALTEFLVDCAPPQSLHEMSLSNFQPPTLTPDSYHALLSFAQYTHRLELQVNTRRLPPRALMPFPNLQQFSMWDAAGPLTREIAAQVLYTAAATLTHFEVQTAAAFDFPPCVNSLERLEYLSLMNCDLSKHRGLFSLDVVCSLASHAPALTKLLLPKSPLAYPTTVQLRTALDKIHQPPRESLPSLSHLQYPPNDNLQMHTLLLLSLLYAAPRLRNLVLTLPPSSHSSPISELPADIATHMATLWLMGLESLDELRVILAAFPNLRSLDAPSLPDNLTEMFSLVGTLSPCLESLSIGTRCGTLQGPLSHPLHALTSLTMSPLRMNVDTLHSLVLTLTPSLRTLVIQFTEITGEASSAFTASCNEGGPLALTAVTLQGFRGVGVTATLLNGILARALNLEKVSLLQSVVPPTMAPVPPNALLKCIEFDVRNTSGITRLFVRELLCSGAPIKCLSLVLSEPNMTLIGSSWADDVPENHSIRSVSVQTQGSPTIDDEGFCALLRVCRGATLANVESNSISAPVQLAPGSLPNLTSLSVSSSQMTQHGLDALRLAAPNVPDAVWSRIRVPKAIEAARVAQQQLAQEQQREQQRIAREKKEEAERLVEREKTALSEAPRRDDVCLYFRSMPTRSAVPSLRPSRERADHVASFLSSGSSALPWPLFVYGGHTAMDFLGVPFTLTAEGVWSSVGTDGGKRRKAQPHDPHGRVGAVVGIVCGGRDVLVTGGMNGHGADVVEGDVVSALATETGVWRSVPLRTAESCPAVDVSWSSQGRACVSLGARVLVSTGDRLAALCLDDKEHAVWRGVSQVTLPFVWDVPTSAAVDGLSMAVFVVGVSLGAQGKRTRLTPRVFAVHLGDGMTDEDSVPGRCDEYTVVVGCPPLPMGYHRGNAIVLEHTAERVRLAIVGGAILAADNVLLRPTAMSECIVLELMLPTKTYKWAFAPCRTSDGDPLSVRGRIGATVTRLGGLQEWCFVGGMAPENQEMVFRDVFRVTLERVEDVPHLGPSDGSAPMDMKVEPAEEEEEEEEYATYDGGVLDFRPFLRHASMRRVVRTIEQCAGPIEELYLGGKWVTSDVFGTISRVCAGETLRVLSLAACTSQVLLERAEHAMGELVRACPAVEVFHFPEADQWNEGAREGNAPANDEEREKEWNATEEEEEAEEEEEYAEDEEDDEEEFDELFENEMMAEVLMRGGRHGGSDDGDDEGLYEDEYEDNDEEGYGRAMEACLYRDRVNVNGLCARLRGWTQLREVSFGPSKQQTGASLVALAKQVHVMRFVQSHASATYAGVRPTDLRKALSANESQVREVTVPRMGRDAFGYGRGGRGSTAQLQALLNTFDLAGLVRVDLRDGVSSSVIGPALFTSLPTTVRALLLPDASQQWDAALTDAVVVAFVERMGSLEELVCPIEQLTDAFATSVARHCGDTLRVFCVPSRVTEIGLTCLLERVCGVIEELSFAHAQTGPQHALSAAMMRLVGERCVCLRVLRDGGARFDADGLCALLGEGTCVGGQLRELGCGFSVGREGLLAIGRHCTNVAVLHLSAVWHGMDDDASDGTPVLEVLTQGCAQVREATLPYGLLVEGRLKRKGQRGWSSLLRSWTRLERLVLHCDCLDDDLQYAGDYMSESATPNVVDGLSRVMAGTRRLSRVRVVAAEATGDDGPPRQQSVLRARFPGAFVSVVM